MAIYHFSGTIISRSQGRSAMACAAYRSGERLYDERFDKTHDYTQKQDIAHTEILTPPQAPEWMKDREKLWNGVEAFEKRKDAQLAREFNFALPRELTLEQNIVLVREFVQKEFVDKGMVADIAVHNDKTPSGETQPHVHVMLTMREVTSEGFGQKVREWNAKENLMVWREAWADYTNRHLALNGHDLRIDHRTLKEQEIDLEPQHKIGSAVAQDRMARLSDHQRIARENGEKIYNDPNIALTGITRQQSTFTQRDIARFVNRHTEEADQFERVYEKVKTSEEIVFLGLDEKKQERFTTKEMQALEKSMMQKAEVLRDRDLHQVKDSAKGHAAASRNLSSEQKTAFEHLVSQGDLKNVIGYAGTGKSYLLGAAREAWEASGYQVQGVALSGIAAQNLEAGSGISSRTIASHTYYWDKGERHLTSKDILVVDEAGMIGSRQLNRLLEEAHRHQAKVVLVGDPYQLQAIEAGAAFRAIAERTPTVELTEIRRQKIDWQRDATKEFATGKTEHGLQRYRDHDNVHAFETRAAAKQELMQVWNDARISQPDKTQIILSYTRDDVRELNDIARGLRKEQGELGQDQPLQTERGERPFAEKDRIYFLKNDNDLGVKNGTLGTVQRIQNNMLVVRLDKNDLHPEPRTITFSTDRYNDLDHGYAATMYKSQGVTIDRAYVFASKYMDGHSTYVSMSRHREGADLFYGRDEFANDKALINTLSRERSKDVTLDYGIEREGSYAKQHTHDHDRKPEQEQHKQNNLKSEFDLNALRQKYAAQSRDPLNDFKARFEQQNPERAKHLAESVRPAHEKEALQIQKQFSNLDKRIKNNDLSVTDRESLEKTANTTILKTEVMEYLKKTDPALCRQVQDFAAQYELKQTLVQQKQLQKDRGREIDF